MCFELFIVAGIFIGSVWWVLFFFGRAAQNFKNYNDLRKPRR